VLSAKRWYEACASPRIEYLCAPMMSPPFAERLPELAARMGLPLTFTSSQHASPNLTDAASADAPPAQEAM